MADNDYPNLWKRGLIQRRVRERAGHRCEHCGMTFRPGTNLAETAIRRDGRPVVGTVHHIDGDKANCCMRNLVYLCQRCHCFVQWRWAPGQTLPLAWGNQAPGWLVQRNLVFLAHPQMPLFERSKIP